MTDLLISIILTGCAITFTIEFISLITLGFFFKERLYSTLTLPLSFGGMYVFSAVDFTFFISVPATAFMALMLNRYLNKPSVVGTRLPRI